MPVSFRGCSAPGRETLQRPRLRGITQNGTSLCRFRHAPQTWTTFHGCVQDQRQQGAEMHLDTRRCEKHLCLWRWLSLLVYDGIAAAHQRCGFGSPVNWRSSRATR